MSRTVLITGAGGFVGSHLAQGFAAMGYAVIALDAVFDAPTRQRLAGVQLVEAAVTPDTLNALPKANLVIHAAAITTPPQDLGMTEQEHVDANVQLLTACLDHAVATGAENFVFLSSSGVFGPNDGAALHLETTTARGDIAYARAKRAGEAAASAVNNSSFRTISVRLGPIYGPFEESRNSRRVVSQVKRWLDDARAGRAIVVGLPDEQRDWTFAPDLSHALAALLAIEPRMDGVIHLTSANIVANIDLAKAIALLVPNSRVLAQPSGQRARLPMASSRLDMPSLYDWTPLASGLAQTAGACA